MIETNVFVEHKRAGRVVDVRRTHNTWTHYGRDYLSRIVALQTIDADELNDVVQTDYRIRYLGLGIGGVSYSSGTAYAPPLLGAYPPGSDPQSTDGHRYNDENPTSPPISTLERPVRKSGSSDPYNTAPGTDTWLFGATGTYYRDTNSVTYRFVVDCTASDVVYAPFTEMPVSEAGLFHSGASVHDPFSSLVAYVNLDTIFLHVDSIVTVSWTVRFAT